MDLSDAVGEQAHRQYMGYGGLFLRWFKSRTDCPPVVHNTYVIPTGIRHPTDAVEGSPENY